MVDSKPSVWCPFLAVTSAHSSESMPTRIAHVTRLSADGCTNATDQIDNDCDQKKNDDQSDDKDRPILKLKKKLTE